MHGRKEARKAVGLGKMVAFFKTDVGPKIGPDTGA
jgi:hypothetical protein